MNLSQATLHFIKQCSRKVAFRMKHQHEPAQQHSFNRNQPNPTYMKKVIDFLKSETLVFLTLVFVLIAQIIHSMYIFERIRVADMSFHIGAYHITALNWTHALIFSVAIESAILMFILNGKRLPSKIYAVASFATNILYYGTWKLDYPEMVATVIASSMLAGSIWFFSDLFAEKIELLPFGQSQEELKKFLATQELEERNKMTFKKVI
jgi:hypothetical protein